MCGIAGFILKKETSSYENNVKKINQILNLISYRGPDKKHYISDKKYSFGTNRLAIESLTNGDQPIKFDDLIVGFNGEIFNYKNLIKIYNLDPLTVDSEVKLIANLYKKFSEKFLDLIRGQFAIYIFDTSKNELFLARDKHGIRPIYYWNESDFVFASEIKCILKYSKKKINFSKKSLAQTCFFWTNIGETTSFDKIKILPPGHYLKYNTNNLIVRRYYQNQIIQKRDENVISNKNFYDLLNNAVENQLHGEVGHACYLSGGIDSVILAYLLKKKISNLDTFSVSFENVDYDESYYQKKISKFLKTNHKQIKISSMDIANNFAKVIEHTETYLFRTAPVPMYLLSKEVKKSNHKVVFSGEGADEVLLGYDIFFENRIRKFWSKFPDSKIRYKLLQKLYNHLPQFKNSRYFEMIKDFYKKNLKSTDDLFYSHLVRWSQYEQTREYFNLKEEKFNAENLVEEFLFSLPKNFKDQDDDRKTQLIEENSLLSNYLLSSQGDRASSANSVETRYPYLDEDFSKDIFRIKSKLKAPGTRSKDLLRKSFKNFLPHEIVYRPKFAYQAPEAKSFLSENHISPIANEYFENIKNLNNQNSDSIYDLFKKIKHPASSERIGFRENMAFIIGLSDYCLKNYREKYSNKNDE